MNDCNNSVYTYKVGERKFLRVVIRPINNLDTVVITSATYTLTDKDGVIVDSGDCTIDGKEVTALITAEAEGVYTYEATISIGAEIYKPRAVIRVRG